MSGFVEPRHIYFSAQRTISRAFCCCQTCCGGGGFRSGLEADLLGDLKLCPCVFCVRAVVPRDAAV